MTTWVVRPVWTLVMCGAAVACAYTQATPARSADPGAVQNRDGLQVLVVEQNRQPAVRIVLPDHPRSDRSIEVLFPEHVTAVKHGTNVAEQLYLFRPGQQGERTEWRRVGRSLEYQRELAGQIRLVARAILEADGVRFHYELTNNSDVAYDMIYAVTDPRLTGIFHDVRLERTYVHHVGGFDLLASETPARLTMPLDRWLPARYLASYRWPVPAQRVEDRGDGITYYNKSRAVDQPLIATLSADGAWIVASVARETGNVWSNPELTCQHVDPQTPLLPGRRAILEVKLLVVRASLDEVLKRTIQQRESLQ